MNSGALLGEEKQPSHSACSEGTCFEHPPITPSPRTSWDGDPQGTQPPPPCPAASPKAPFLAISRQAPKQSFCFKLLALICLPADPVHKREMKSFPLGGMLRERVCWCLPRSQAFRPEGLYKPRAKQRELAEVEIKSNGSSFSEGCASCAPSESGLMEKNHL